MNRQLFGWLFAVSLLTSTISTDGFACQATETSVDRSAGPNDLPAGYSIPVLDLSDQAWRQTIVDRQPGQYLGHPTTVLLEDGKSIVCVYPKGHGRGAIILKRSDDGGRTWSERLPVPDNWSTSLETPTIHRVVDPQGKRRLILFSGLYPIRMSVSEDDGRTWSPLKKIGDYGGIVAMGCVESTGDGHYLALFHDDGRFISEGGRKSDSDNRFRVYQVESNDGGLTWSEPRVIASHPKAQLCEPGLIRSPDGKQMAVLLRENSRQFNSFVITSDDEGKTWSEPRQVSAALTGDRHTGTYTDDGRLFISFRDTTRESPTRGDWVAWVGDYQDIVTGQSGQYRVRLMDNHKGFDCAYPGVVRLPDDTIVTTTYGHWAEGQSPYIVSVRLKVSELDAMAEARPSQGQEPAVADHWDRFRGPGGNGISSKSFPTRFDASDFAWTSNLAGSGNGSPVTWQDRVFVQSADRETGDRILQCLSLDDGQELWQYRIAGPVERVHAWGSFASSTPAVDGQHVYVTWGSRQQTVLLALNHQGQEVWKKELGPSIFTHGYGASPTVVKDQVILFHSQQADQLPAGQAPGVSRMLAFQCDDGTLRWETELKTTRVCYGVPATFQNAKGQIQIVGANTGNGVFVLDGATGKLLWDSPVVKQRSVASPVIQGPIALVSSGSGGGGNEVVAVDLETQQEIYRISRNANYVPTLIVVDPYVFVPGDKGILSCVDLKSGEVLGRKRLGPGAFGISSSPVAADGKLYLISDSGTVKVIEATPEMDELGEAELGQPTRATPAVGGDMLIFRTDTRVMALESK